MKLNNFCWLTVPSLAPEDLRCAALTSTSLQVSWQPPPINHQNGLLQGYKVSFEPMADDHMQGKKVNSLRRRESTFV